MADQAFSSQLQSLYNQQLAAITNQQTHWRTGWEGKTAREIVESRIKFYREQAKMYAEKVESCERAIKLMDSNPQAEELIKLIEDIKG